MPKENINDEVTDGFRVEVTWNAGSWLQVASVNQHSTLTLPADDEGEKVAQPFDGWRVTLDRHGVNRLIRSLRKARDAAFGADA